MGSATTNAVTINALASAVTVGVDTLNGIPTNVAAPTGAVVVNDGTNLTGITPINGPFDAILNINPRNVVVEGGTVTNVTINTNQGAVMVGSADTPATNAAEPTAIIVVADSAGYVNPNSTTIDGTGNAALDSRHRVRRQRRDRLGHRHRLGRHCGRRHAVGPAVHQHGRRDHRHPGGHRIGRAVQRRVGGLGVSTGSTVSIYGGTVDTVKTTGGSVLIGSPAAPAAGAVTITDTFNLPTGFAGFGAMAAIDNDAFRVVGGAAVTITTAPTSGVVNVGNAAPVLNAGGIALANAAQYASGNVAISDYSGSAAGKVALVYGTGAAVVNTLGATSVSIIGTGVATVTDMNTTLATQGPGAGAPIAATTLTTVTLDHVGVTTLNDNPTALTLGLFDGAGNITVNDVNAHTIALTVGASAGTLVDNTATSIVLGDSATAGVGATAAGALTISGTKLTSLTLNNAAAQTITLPVADALLASIVAANGGLLTLGNLTGLGALKTITAGAGSTGGVTAAINPQTTSFLGGGSTGNDTITITQPNATVGASVGQVTAGGGSNNIVVLDYNNTGIPALGQISAFQNGAGRLWHTGQQPISPRGRLRRHLQPDRLQGCDRRRRPRRGRHLRQPVGRDHPGDHRQHGALRRGPARRTRSPTSCRPTPATTRWP